MSQQRSHLIESIRVLLPVLVLVFAGGGYYVMANRERPQDREEPADSSPLVETVAIQKHGQGLDIEVDGLVVPYREIQLAAEVDGRVTQKAEECRAGRYVKKGDLLIEIFARDYEIEFDRLDKELAQAENSIAELEVEIANTESLIELAEEEVALQHEEYERLNDLFEETVLTESEIDAGRRSELVAKTALLGLRNQLQLKNASRGRLESARDRARVMREKAKLDVSRTTITAPVSGVVVADSVEEDSYVKKGSILITIEDTSAVEVKCNLRVEELAWVWRQSASPESVPEPADGESGYAIRETPVTVVYSLEGNACEWKGLLSRYDGIGLDETTRTVPCRVVVDDPTGGRTNGGESSAGCPPALMRGMFVTVRIHVDTEVDLLSVPSAAVRPGGRLWLMENDEMKLVPASIVNILEDRVLIHTGDPHPAVDDKVIVSPLPFSADGMAVRESPES